MRTIENIKRKFKKGKYYKVRIGGSYWLLRFDGYKGDGTIAYSDIGSIELYDDESHSYHEYCRAGVFYTEDVETMETMSDEDVIKYFKHRFGNI